MSLYIVNYRHRKSEPLKSIMQLPREEAFALAERLYSQSQCRAHRRFGPDFPSYYEYRIRVEEWLYESFLKIGGKPQTKHPFYFALEDGKCLYENFDMGESVRICIDDIDDCDISFTFGDSMRRMEMSDCRPLFSKRELLSHIEAHNNDVSAFLDSISDPYMIIEAQLWTDKHFNL